MKILNLHGLNGSSHNTNYRFLSAYFADRNDVIIVSPQIDYEKANPHYVIDAFLPKIDEFDIIVGNSFGGFFAYTLGSFSNKAKTLLVNPCIPPYFYIPKLVENYKYTEELKQIFESAIGNNHNYSVLLGDSDDVLDIQITLNILNPKNFKIISGGHSLSGCDYEKWFKEELK